MACEVLAVVIPHGFGNYLYLSFITCCTGGVYHISNESPDPNK